MNKLKLRERLVFILSFLLPSLALILIFAVKEIYPFGDNSFLRTDMYHQYAPFFSEFADKLQNGGSLLYSWKIGAGSNFITLLAYYLCSPFNLLLVFLSKPAIIEFMTYLIVFKTGLCGLSMAWYLCRRFSTRNICAALFAMGYALSGYMAAYSWNIMWLDCIWLAPLVLLGLELLVEENKGLMYCITLALSILTNYYISIMLCMFLVLYFFVPSDPASVPALPAGGRRQKNLLERLRRQVPAVCRLLSFSRRSCGRSFDPGHAGSKDYRVLQHQLSGQTELLFSYDRHAGQAYGRRRDGDRPRSLAQSLQLRRCFCADASVYHEPEYLL